MADIIIKLALSEQIDIRPWLGGSVAIRTIAEAESRSLQQLFGLSRTSACNIVFIVIDFKNYYSGKEMLVSVIDQAGCL